MAGGRGAPATSSSSAAEWDSMFAWLKQWAGPGDIVHDYSAVSGASSVVIVHPPIRHHPIDEGWGCSVCSTAFSTLRAGQDHLLRLHPAASASLHKCQVQILNRALAPASAHPAASITSTFRLSAAGGDCAGNSSADQRHASASDMQDRLCCLAWLSASAQTRLAARATGAP